MKSCLVKKSRIHGLGLFANKNFKKGELIFKVDISKLPKLKPNTKISKEDELHLDYVGRGMYAVSHYHYAFIVKCKNIGTS